MRNTRNPEPRSLLLGSFTTLFIFAAHHVYGAVLYRTPWRHHAAIVAFMVGAALLAAVAVYRRLPPPAGRVAAWALVTITLLFVGAAVGLFEGLYNHVLKDVLFLAGAPRSLLLSLFPPPKYEMPNDLLFEVSGVLQPVAAAFAVVGALRFARGLVHSRRPGSNPGPSVVEARHRASAKLNPGSHFAARVLATVSGGSVRVPGPAQLTHLQLRRFAGCPVCNLHLRSVARRHEELVAAGVREVVVFHSSVEELRPHVSQLPFDVVADPGKRLYAEFGAEASPRAVLDPRAWWPIVRAVLHALVDLVRGAGAVPPLKPKGGRFGLPADFLIGSDGRVLACKYGAHVDDQWSVDDLLALAAAARRQGVRDDALDEHRGIDQLTDVGAADDESRPLFRA